MAERVLNAEQLQAVTHGDGPLLIIAGAGTGKTTVVTTRIQNLILEKKIPPNNILALTFTEKAAAEMESRVDEIMPFGYTQMWIETFHAFADRVLRQEAIHVGLNPGFDLLTEAESLLFLRKHLFEFDLSYFRPLGNPMKFLQGMLSHFARLKDDDISPEQYLQYAKGLSFRAKPPVGGEVEESQIKKLKKGDPSTSVGMTSDEDEIKKTLELANAFKKYEDLKTKEGVMDFSDLISNTLNLFRTRKNILSQYQDMFQYIMVDEFQDTNYAQNELAILLAGDKQNITVVGDDDQSIYRWRGAAISNMIQFRSHFPKAKIITLTKNYRSTQRILDASYQLIQNNNPDRLEAKEKIDKKLVSQRNVILEEAKRPIGSSAGDSIATLQNDNDIEFIYTNKAEDEAEEVAKKIQELSKGPNLKYNDFAILVRANDHSTPFLRALERRRIPYQFLGPGHLFQQPEIKDLVAYLHALANFEDTSAVYRVITQSVFDVAARDVASLLNFAKKNNYSLFEAMENASESGLTEEGKEKTKRIVEMMKRHLAKIPSETAGQILYYFFEDSGLLGHYLDPKSARTEKEAQNVAKFFEKLQNFAANRDDASVFAVVDWIDLSMELGESPLAADIDWSQNNAVNILTVHSSKGLEFPVVFVVNLVTQRFPSRDRKEQIPVPEQLIKEVLPTGDESLQEERRLFYVAMTRAKDSLFLTASKFYGEGKRERKLSPFLVESLGEEYIKSTVKKQTAVPIGQQLSLLEVFNANIQNQQAENQSEVSGQKPSAISYISYSQIATFLSCPLHYKLRYILNFPSPAAPALSYGISVHSCLRDILLAKKADEEISDESIKSILKKNWIKDGYSGKTHEQKTYDQAEKILLGFWENYQIEKPQTIGIETPFSFWLARPTGSGQSKLKVGGRIDRVDRLPDNKIEIIDYKTGKNMLTDKKAEDDLQLSFYALAATEVHDQIFGKTTDEVLLTLHYLESNQKVSTTRSKEDLEMAKEKILSIITEIENSDFRCSRGLICKDCEYNLLCESNK